MNSGTVPREMFSQMEDRAEAAEAERDRWKAAENAQTDLLQQVFDALGGDPVRDTVDVLAINVKAELDRLAAQVERVRALSDWFDSQPNWLEWQIGPQIRRALEEPSDG